MTINLTTQSVGLIFQATKERISEEYILEEIIENELSNSQNNKNKNFVLALPFYPPISLVNNLSISILNSIYFRLNKLSKNNLQHYRNFFFPLDVISNWNKA